MERNDAPGGSRGQGTALCSDGRDLITPATLLAETAPVQLPLFGLVVGIGERVTVCGPYPRCKATIGFIEPGRGPHYAGLRCHCGHHRWLPKPGEAR